MKAGSNATAARRTPWRDNIEALVMAIVLALLFKAYIVEAYKIPTGSMQPTLMGDAQNKVFDRILVDKLAYRVRDPERFEVVVFRYPLDRSKNFVKRLVGMPGEQLRIRHGDLWVRADENEEWRIVRRPANVQTEHWKALDVNEPPSPRWVSVGAGADTWSFGPRSIDATGPGRARYGRDGAPIVDDYFDGYPDALRPRGISAHPRSRQYTVGDLRIEARVTARADANAIVLELTEGALSYRAHVPGPAAAADARPWIESGPADRVRALPSESVRREGDPFRLAAGDTTALYFENLDDRLTLGTGGRTLVELDIESASDQRALAYLAVEGGGAQFEDVELARDIFYSQGREDVYTIPDEQYFMLGDNTQDSSDSREWSFVRYRMADGSIVRGNNRRAENPLFVTGDPRGPVVWLRDEWGETHHFNQRDAAVESPIDAPFVDRSLVLGRALAVFWPIQPTRDIWRVKWVQ